MIIDLDNSFLRLRDNLNDAKDLGESVQVDKTLAQYTQVHLCPNEVYFQISNSPTPIVFNDDYEVFAVDECGVELEDVTTRVFIEQFVDNNGIVQIRWEFINPLEYYKKPLSLRFRNTINEDTWYTNLFISTVYNVEFTNRYVYKNFENHYGTQYERSNYYQSIRLNTYYRNKINESERAEYHQITTDVTVPQRNIKKIKERYLLISFNTWTTERLETMLSSNEVYIDTVRTYSTNPIEFLAPELDANFTQNEMILSKDYSKTFIYDFQIFDGLQLSNFNPSGIYVTILLIEALSFDTNIPIQLNTGTLRVYTSDDNLVYEFNESDMVLNSDTQIKIISTGTPVESLPLGEYYVNVSAGLVSGFGIPNNAILDSTTWTFSILNGQFNRLQFNNSQFLTN